MLLKKSYFVIFIALLFTFFTAPLYSETDSIIDKVSKSLGKKDVDFPTLNIQGSGAKDSSSSILPAVWCSKIEDNETQKICWKAYQASLSYFNDGLQHRLDVFKWQHFSTKAIFFIVILLVAIGVYFAWIQFKIDLNTDNIKLKNNEKENHTVEVSTSGIKVSSPVLGVIILTLSLVFFYLYLTYVYPITEIF